jgi:glycosyltransferase involved in cell wall biosynthesis
MEAPYDGTLTRADFGLSVDDFLVLMMFDSNSYASRKNPGAAIDAFREAYGENPEHVKLVIKINNPKDEDIAFVEEHIGGTAGYTLITERMDKEKLNSLIRLCDVFISLHRGEGFGLVMAEAMMLGTPCVATNWSANTEFMNEETACMVGYELVPVNGEYPGDDGTMQWAEPDVQQAAEFLKRLREEPEYYKEKAEKGFQYISKKLSMKACAEAIKERMSQILG